MNKSADVSTREQGSPQTCPPGSREVAGTRRSRHAADSLPAPPQNPSLSLLHLVLFQQWTGVGGE